MAVVKGTNCGFVTEAPDADPGGSSTDLDPKAIAIKDVSPVGAAKIVEIGWYCNNATPEANFEVGIYDHEPGSDVPQDLIHVERVNAKGTGAGWKKVTGLNWPIDAETIYWLAAQLDDTDPDTGIDYTSNGERSATTSPVTELPDPYPPSAIYTSIKAIYAVWEEADGGVEHTHFPTDTMNMSDSLSVAATYNVSLDDTLSIDDAIGAVATLRASLSDTLQISDALIAAVTYNVALADTMGITDSLAVAAAYAVALSDTMNMSDALAVGWGFYISLADTMEISDSLSYELFEGVVKKLKAGHISGLKPARVVKAGRIGV